MNKLIGIFKSHKLRAIALMVVVAIAALTTIQQVSQNQDLRQRASGNVGLEFGISNSNVGVGQKLDTVVILNNTANKPVTSFDITVSYDTKALSYNGSTVIEPFSGLITTSTPESGKVRIAGTITGNSTLSDFGDYPYAKIVNITFLGKTPSSSTLGFSNANVAALDESKSVVNLIKTAPITVVSPGTPTPTQQCKSGINSFSATQDGCNPGTYKTIQIGCYDGYTTNVSTPSCTSYSEIMKYATQFCEGRTSCSPKATATPTPASAGCPDSNPDGTVNVCRPGIACASGESLKKDGEKACTAAYGVTSQCCTRQPIMPSPSIPRVTPSPTKLPTPTPTPTNLGYIYGVMNPTGQTIRIIQNSTTSAKVIAQSTSKISQQVTAGNYYVQFIYSNKRIRGLKTPPAKSFTVKKGQTVSIVGDFKSGTTTIK